MGYNQRQELFFTRKDKTPSAHRLSLRYSQTQLKKSQWMKIQLKKSELKKSELKKSLPILENQKEMEKRRRTRRETSVA